MPRPYSQDLRDRVIAAVAAGSSARVAAEERKVELIAPPLPLPGTNPHVRFGSYPDFLP